MRRVAPALTALLVLAACMRGSIVRQGRVDEDALAAVCTRLETVRGLDFTRRVPARALDREEMRAALEQEIRRSYMPGDFERLQLVYGRLGLLPPGTDLEAGLRRLLDEEAAGFYDPRSKELVLSTYALAAGGLRLRLLSFVTGRDFAGEFFLSHELTHALQDQHYGIDTEPEPLTHAHGDRLLAERALLEGDATLTGFAYVVQEPLSAHTAAVVGPELGQTATQLAARYPDVPEVLRASLAFQYVEGSAFVGDVLAAGGLPALDRAHRDPPASTAEVLHPQRYLSATRIRPAEVVLGGTEALERDGWTLIVEDTLGELDVRLLAARALPAEGAARVGDGWAGDRLRAFARGDTVVLVWMTVWDTPADAAEFADVVPRATTDAHVEQRDERVLVVLAPAGDVSVERLAGSVWAHTTVAKPS